VTKVFAIIFAPPVSTRFTRFSVKYQWVFALNTRAVAVCEYYQPALFCRSAKKRKLFIIREYTEPGRLDNNGVHDLVLRF